MQNKNFLIPEFKETSNEDINRREFLNSFIQFSSLVMLTSLPLSKSLAQPSSISNKPIDAMSKFWIAWNEQCRDLKSGKITQRQWMKLHKETAANIDPEDINRYIGLDQMLTRNPDWYYRHTEMYGVGTRNGAHPAVNLKIPYDGFWEILGKKIEGFDLIPFVSLFVYGRNGQYKYGLCPHGHQDVAGSIMVMRGEFRVRHYDRVKQFNDHWLLSQPTIDEIAKPGALKTLCEDVDNIHWATNEGNLGVLLNIHLGEVTAMKGSTFNVFLDPTGEIVDGGLIKADLITGEEAVERFSKVGKRMA